MSNWPSKEDLDAQRSLYQDCIIFASDFAHVVLLYMGESNDASAYFESPAEVQKCIRDFVRLYCRHGRLEFIGSGTGVHRDLLPQMRKTMGLLADAGVLSQDETRVSGDGRLFVGLEHIADSGSLTEFVGDTPYAVRAEIVELSISQPLLGSNWPRVTLTLSLRRHRRHYIESGAGWTQELTGYRVARLRFDLARDFNFSGSHGLGDLLCLRVMRQSVDSALKKKSSKIENVFDVCVDGGDEWVSVVFRAGSAELLFLQTLPMDDGAPYYISRGDWWRSTPESPITRAEIDALISTDAELSWFEPDYVDSRSSLRDNTEGAYIAWNGVPTFLWKESKICCHEPDPALVSKMMRMASALSAWYIDVVNRMCHRIRSTEIATEGTVETVTLENLSTGEYSGPLFIPRDK